MAIDWSLKACDCDVHANFKLANSGNYIRQKHMLEPQLVDIKKK